MADHDHHQPGSPGFILSERRFTAVLWVPVLNSVITAYHHITVPVLNPVITASPPYRRAGRRSHHCCVTAVRNDRPSPSLPSSPSRNSILDRTTHEIPIHLRRMFLYYTASEATRSIR